METETTFGGNYGPQRLSVELASTCNLHCSYCFRADDNLYKSPAQFLPLELLRRVIYEARVTANITSVGFTGGEPTLHPEFGEILRTVAEAGLAVSFVTNGWHFERVWPALRANRASLSHVAFSLDGLTREDHDRWRGEGSFDRVVRAFSRCHMSKLPFAIKVVIRRDLMHQLEPLAIFAARMGAAALHFAHVMPTSSAIAGASSLTLEEQQVVQQEIAILARILKMQVRLDVGYYNLDEERPPCSPLAGANMNIDYRGRLSLCCNLSGFRGAAAEMDVVADLNVEPFSSALAKLRELASAQLEKRKHALVTLRSKGVTPDLYVGSPCLFCLQSYGKIPWHNGAH